MSDYPQGTFNYTGGIGGPDGLPILGGWEVTLTHSLTPDPIHVRAPMSASGQPPDKNGDVILRYGDREPITLRDCTIDKIDPDISGKRIWTFTILDRRYRWRDGEISGRYNVRTKNGTDIRPETKKKPSQLAALCLDRMLEANYDVASLEAFDGTDWPAIDWDVARPVEVLQQLCERYGCRAIFDWQQDAVVVVVVGEGRQLDLSLPYVQYSGSFDPPEVPGALIVLGGPSSVQYDFPLVAKALDQDGTIKPPDQVSYAPLPISTSGVLYTSGTFADTNWVPWAGVDVEFANIKIPCLRHLAQISMLRWYQIVPPVEMPGIDVIKGDDFTLDPIQFASLADATEESPTWLRQIELQVDQNDLLSALADPQNTQFDEYNREVSQTPLQAWVYGHYFDATAGGNFPHDDFDPEGAAASFSGISKLDPSKVTTVLNLSTAASSPNPFLDNPSALEAYVKETGFYTGGFSIDAEHGIVKFSQPVYQCAAPQDAGLTYVYASGAQISQAVLNDGAIFPATLWLRARFLVRDLQSGAYIRYQKTRELDANNPRARYLVKNDLVLKATYRFAPPADVTNYPPTFSSSGLETNQDAIDEAADAYLDQIEQEYDVRRPESIVHPGFYPFTLDGAIRQVTWMVDDEGHPFTRVSRDQEELHIVRDYKERRLAQRLMALADQQQRREEFNATVRREQELFGLI